MADRAGAKTGLLPSATSFSRGGLRNQSRLGRVTSLQGVDPPTLLRVS